MRNRNYNSDRESRADDRAPDTIFVPAAEQHDPRGIIHRPDYAAHANINAGLPIDAQLSPSNCTGSYPPVISPPVEENNPNDHGRSHLMRGARSTPDANNRRDRDLE